MILFILKGIIWYTENFIPAISPLTLIALLFTIVIMFSLKGELIVEIPMDVLIIAVPLILYFSLMFLISFFFTKAMGASYKENAAVSLDRKSTRLNSSHVAISYAVFCL